MTYQPPPCPANGARCTHDCRFRPACTEHPEKVMALMERMDREIELAITRIARNQ